MYSEIIVLINNSYVISINDEESLYLSSYFCIINVTGNLLFKYFFKINLSLFLLIILKFFLSSKLLFMILLLSKLPSFII